MSEENKERMQFLSDWSKKYQSLFSIVAIVVSLLTICYQFGWISRTVEANAKAIENFPNTYVTKAEYNATIESIKSDIKEIKDNIKSINQTLLYYKLEIK